ncbi:MAG: DUF502 domain-containing protein [Proteobacteria bacterium]|nr:DUF502 domain-containing protein [Pseudomonadota bacterium]MBU4295361.1 DUF502 domain-containing protein [Pseudomonadota bacterium]MCG2749381.1 DUF502 domain-containing protein [Desulfobulbaceae bacterium]
MIYFKRIKKIILTGLIAVLPITATLYLLVWLMTTAEKVLGGVLKFIFPEGWYWPGMGFVAGLAMIFVVGLMMENFFARKVMQWVESLIYRVPLIKSIYRSVRDFLTFLSRGKEKGPRQVVTMEVGQTGIKLVGFVTRHDLTFLGAGSDDERVAVYFPLSYQIGGYTALVPLSALQPLDVPLEKAMQFVMTAGIIEAGRQKDS